IAAGLLALVFVFLPGMLLVLGITPLWDKLSTLPHAHAVIRGINAAVVGVLVAAFLTPIVPAGITGPLTLGVALASLTLLILKAPPWLVVLGGAVAGMAAEFVINRSLTPV